MRLTTSARPSDTRRQSAPICLLKEEAAAAEEAATAAAAQARKWAVAKAVASAAALKQTNKLVALVESAEASRRPVGRLLTLTQIRAENVPAADVATKPEGRRRPSVMPQAEGKRRSVVADSGVDSSDPFLKAAIVGSAEQGAVVLDQLVTSHVPDCRDPKWDERLRLIVPYKPGDDMDALPNLRLGLWDKDYKNADDLLCEATIVLPAGRGELHHTFEHVAEGKVDGDMPSVHLHYDLTPLMYVDALPNGESVAFHAVAMTEALDQAHKAYARGSLKSGSRVITLSRLRAAGIPQNTNEGTGRKKDSDEPDPYVKLELVDGTSGVVLDELATPYVRNSTTPAWNGLFRLWAPPTKGPPTLRVSLWDKDWKNDDDLLGSETLIPLDRPSREGDVAQVLPCDLSGGLSIKARPSVHFHYQWTDSFVMVA